MQIVPFFHNLVILLFSEIVIFIINWYEDFVSSNSVCNRIYNKILDRNWLSESLFVT